ncbi:DUF2397 family protein [bacterium]|nr:DUF2397 family protein [bacterium]
MADDAVTYLRDDLALTPQPDLFRELAPQPTFIESVPLTQFSFLATERRLVYATILYYLYLRRQSHEIEKYHNDVYDAVQPTIEGLIQNDYSLAAFRADMDQLVAWRNIERRLEPYRLQRISDRRLQKFLYRLSNETRCLIDSLATLRPPQDAERVFLDQDHLLDVEDYLLRAERIREATGERDEDTLRRLARCFVEIDTRCRRIATEITEFGARIAAFNNMPFQLESLADIIDWLDRYVEQYLQRVAKLGPTLYHRLREWEYGPSRELLEQAERATREHFMSNPLAGQWADRLRSTDEVLYEICPFFAPEGLFAELCERINEQVRSLVRKIRMHLDDIRRRNIRIQALRKRTRELMRAPEGPVDQVRRWLDELVGSGHQVNDAAGGTPRRRAAPPRPTYYRRRMARPPFQANLLEAKSGSMDLSRELERQRTERLTQFVVRNLLDEQPMRTMRGAQLEKPDDVRSYLDAVKTYFIGRRKLREQLGFVFIPPGERQLTLDGDEETSAEFRGDGWRFVSPNYRVEAKTQETPAAGPASS